MPIQRLKRAIKKHRAIDWFAMAILISVAIVIASVLSSKVEQFSKDMELEAELKFFRAK